MVAVAETVAAVVVAVVKGVWSSSLQGDKAVVGGFVVVVATREGRTRSGCFRAGVKPYKRPPPVLGVASLPRQSSIRVAVGAASGFRRSTKPEVGVVKLPIRFDR